MRKVNRTSNLIRLAIRGQIKGIILSTIFLVAIALTSCKIDSTDSKAQVLGNESSSSEYITQTDASQAKMTPEMAVETLKEGNARFTDESMVNRDLIAQVKQTGGGQYPFAAIVSCIDSRIPTEIVFDQGDV